MIDQEMKLSLCSIKTLSYTEKCECRFLYRNLDDEQKKKTTIIEL